MSAQDGPPAVAAPAVQAALRSLRLPGMADMLGQRLAQAAAGGLGHAELLALLIGDERTRRDSTGLARRLAAAHFEATCAVEDYDFAFNPQIPAGTIRDLTSLRVPDCRAVDHPARAGRGRQNHDRPSPRATRLPPRTHRRCSPRPAGCSPTSPAATPTGPGRPGSSTGPARRC